MKKAGLTTGNNAFTLIEILLAVAVLSGGAAVVFPAFFKSADLLARVSEATRADLAANNLAVGLEETFRSEQGLQAPMLKGETVLDDHAYAYDISAAPQDKTGRVVELQVNLDPKGAGNGRHSESVYILR